MKLRGNKLTAAVKLCFAAAVILALSTGFVRAVFFPKDVNEYESRMANQFPAFTAESFADSSFQDGAEDALSDQLPLSAYFKKAYNLIKVKYMQLTAFPYTDKIKDTYLKHDTINYYNNMLVYKKISMSEAAPRLDKILNKYNKLVQESNAEFFQYYIESDHDIDFESGEKSGVFEYIKAQSQIPEENISRLEINNFEEYLNRYYATDIHWNYKGSYDGYRDILHLIGCEDAALEPQEEVLFPKMWRGAKAKDIGNETISETFSAYRFDFPDMEFHIDGEQADDYGIQEACFENPETDVAYMSFYGGSSSEAIIDTGRKDRENLLIIGDSFAHAIFKLTASHFNRTYLIDPRRNDISVGELADYIRDNEIDKVLFLNYYITLADERFIIPG